MSVLLQLLVGAVVGVLVGITGTGGAFVIPALMYLEWISYARKGQHY